MSIQKVNEKIFVTTRSVCNTCGNGRSAPYLPIYVNAQTSINKRVFVSIFEFIQYFANVLIYFSEYKSN